MSMSEKKLNQLRDIINNSDYVVCMIGCGVQSENGYPVMQESDWTYEMEMKYGDSPEEIFNTSFYSTRKEQFFDFYRNEMLSKDYEPNESYRVLAELERRGRVKTIITTGIYSLEQRAGCKNVIELYGNIYRNYCGHCRKEYNLDYVKQAAKVPVCTECNSVVRPGVFLYGEMIDNRIMTKAMEEVAKADTFIVFGESINSPRIISCLSYFKGNRLIVINDKPSYSDKKAYLVIEDKAINILPQIL